MLQRTADTDDMTKEDEWDAEALVVADDMYTAVFDEGGAARVVPEEDKAEQVRRLIRATAEHDGLQVRTARTDDTVAAVRIRGAKWFDDAAVDQKDEDDAPRTTGPSRQTDDNATARRANAESNS